MRSWWGTRPTLQAGGFELGCKGASLGCFEVYKAGREGGGSFTDSSWDTMLLRLPPRPPLHPQYKLPGLTDLPSHPWPCWLAPPSLPSLTRFKMHAHEL